MATPSVITAQYSNAYISTFDYHMPEKRDILYRKYGDQGLEFFKMIDKLGFSSPVAQQDYSHFEEDWIWTPVNSRAGVVSPGAGNPINFTLAAYNLDSGNRFFIAVGDNVMFANQVTGTVTAINVTVPAAPVVTVYPNGGANIGALSADDTIIIYSNDYAEGTGQPEGKVARVIEYSFNTKIVKETNAYTGSEATNKTWFTTTSDGQSIPAIYMKGQIDADYRMALRMNGALLFDETTTNATLLAAGNRTTQGLFPWVRGGGNVQGYNVGFYAMADFDIQNRILDQNFAPSEEVAMLGFDLQTEWENLFVNSFVNGAIVYANFADGGKKATDLSIGFNSFNKNERQWHIKRMTGLNHPQIYGAPGFKLPGSGIVMPIDGRKDPKTGNLLPSVGQRYKALGNYNRKMKVWLTGGAIAVTNQTDADALNIRSEFGSEFIASNRFFLMEEN